MQYCYRFAVGEATNEKLQKCKALLSGEYPEGIDLGTLVDELAEAFLDKKDPGRRAERREKREQKRTSTKPKTQQPGETSRYIRPRTRDAVYNRDGGRCTYVGSDGKRCNSTWDLEIHHEGTPYARGGGHDMNRDCIAARGLRSNPVSAIPPGPSVPIAIFYAADRPA